MADFVERSAKTVKQAINDALEELGISEDEAVIEVLDEGESGGLLGIGRKPAKVKVSKAQPEELSLGNSLDFDGRRQDSDDVPTASDDLQEGFPEDDQEEDSTYYGDDEFVDEPESPAESAALDYVTDILSGIGIHGRISSYEQEGNLYIEVSGRDCGAAIGRRGETLDAIQYLTSLVANQHTDEHLRVIVDIGGYRKRREKTLISIAEKTAYKVNRNGRQFKLDPMNPAERRIVHSALQDFSGVTTFSEGVDPNRYVVIAPAQKD